MMETAQQKVSQIKGVCFLRASKIYETEPVGGPPQGKYLNAVWEIETDLAAEVLLKELLKIENEMGRVRTVKNSPRPIDLDILFYGHEIIKKPGLEIPHPRLHERWFVLKPLADLAPDFVHPVMRKTIKELLNSPSLSFPQSLGGNPIGSPTKVRQKARTDPPKHQWRTFGDDRGLV